jgi:hypothetical protein
MSKHNNLGIRDHICNSMKAETQKNIRVSGNKQISHGQRDIFTKLY